MANNGFAGFDPDQTTALVDAAESLKKRVEDTIAAAEDQFTSALVNSDRVLAECEYKDEVAAQLPKAIAEAKEGMGIDDAFTKFEAKVKEAEGIIGATIVRNTENSEQAMANLKAQAKKAGENVAH